MAPDPLWMLCLEVASWSLVDPSLACPTTEQYPQGSCLPGVENQTTVNKQFIVKLLNLLYCFVWVLKLLHGRL